LTFAVWHYILEGRTSYEIVFVCEKLQTWCSVNIWDCIKFAVVGIYTVGNYVHGQKQNMSFLVWIWPPSYV
jgi:hypothetical protein